MLILRITVLVWLSNTLLSISCLEIGSTENNSSCRRGHFKSSTGECLPCIDGCFRCENDQTCTVCETKYTRTDIGACQLCPKNCNRCDLNKCTTCNNRYFLQNESCVSCPTTCQKCTSRDRCTECTSGSWGPRCDKTCPYTCSRDICNIATGNCDACDEGYFGINCSKCPENCLNNLCNMSGHCTGGCLQGFYGDNKFACTCGCKTGLYIDGIECRSCSKNCKECKSSDQCNRCLDGYYGPVCEFDCSKCQNGACDKLSCINGCKQGFYMDETECKNCSTNCKACYSSDQCSHCLDGYYGPVCEFDCSYCQYSACDKLTCLYGCKQGFYLNGTECKHCPTNCKTCNSSDWCSECEDGTYGQICQQDCNESKCLACKGYESNCTKCQPGYTLTGNKCCSVNCQTCDDDGQCGNCTDGYFGLSCLESCQFRCKSCLNKDKCEECASGRFDSKFSIEARKCSCSTTQCKEKDTNGTCKKCKRSPGWYAYKIGCCACPKNCKDKKCDKDGSCTGDCIKGSLGTHCPTDCPNENCFSCKHGTCEECNAGYFGNECQYECSSNCYQTTEGHVCNIQSGHCLHGCVNGTWGNICEYTCNEGCLDGLCERVSGHCLQCHEGKSGPACLHDDKKELQGGTNSIYVPVVITVSIIVFVVLIVSAACLVRHYKSRKSVRENSVRMNDIDTETGVQRQRDEYDSEEEVITENETYGMFEVPLSVAALEVERARQINSPEAERDTYLYVGGSSTEDSDAVYAVPDKRKYK